MANRFLCAGGWLLSASLITAAQNHAPSPEMRLLQDAAQAIAAGKLTLAENQLQLALGSAPEDYRALDLLGVIRVLQRRQVEAEQLFCRAVHKKSDFAPGHAHLGLLYVQMGLPEAAVPHLREALRIDPARIDASDALVRILQDQSQLAAAAGDSGKVLALLSDARKYAPNNADVHFAFGMTALRMSLLQDAVQAFQQTLKLRKNDPLALYNLGHAFMELSRFEDARQQFAQYVKVRPEDASGYCALGMTLAALERSPEAKTQFERSIALVPGQTESYYRLGRLDLDAEEFEAAAKNLRRVLDREPRHPGALTALGRVAFDQKNYAEAIDLLRQAVANDDAMYEAHYYLGLAFSRVGSKQESEEQLQMATRLEHNEAEHRRAALRILEPPAVSPPRE